MSPPDYSAEPDLIDDPRAPAIFSDAAAGFFAFNGVVHITFAAILVDHTRTPATQKQRVNARLALPIAGAKALALGLYDFLKQQGHDPQPAEHEQLVSLSGPGLELIDDALAPAIFSDLASGFFILHGVVHLTFMAIRIDHNQTPGRRVRVVNARPALPLAGARSLALALYEFLKQQGHDPASRAAGETIQ